MPDWKPLELEGEQAQRSAFHRTCPLIMNTSTKQPVIIYISAASDLMAEREALARMIAALPVTLAWHILQTPVSEADSLDLEGLQSASLHFLIMGSDIRAPVGLERHVARRAHRPVVAYLKQSVPRTPAGQVFINDARGTWQTFRDAPDLSGQIQRVLVEYLVRHAAQYALTPEEVAKLEALPIPDTSTEQVSGGEEAGHSAVVLSHERFEPSEGIILDES
jgi:hypothetical protein